MARKLKISVPAGVYHVILRGNGGQDIFCSDQDRYRFYLLLQERASRFRYRFHGFCLMKIIHIWQFKSGNSSLKNYSELVRYIHLNPVRIEVIDDPADYLFSSNRNYLGREELPWLTTEWILSQFGDNLKHARKKYTEFILDVRFLGYQKEFHYGESDTCILGDDHLLEQVLDQPMHYKTEFAFVSVSGK